MRNLTRDQMVRLSIHPSDDNITFEKEVIKIHSDGNLIAAMFLQPLVIDRSSRDNRMVALTGIAIDHVGGKISPTHIQLDRHSNIQFSYDLYSIGENEQLDEIEKSYQDYDRLRRLLGVTDEPHLSTTRQPRRW